MLVERGQRSDRRQRSDRFRYADLLFTSGDAGICQGQRHTPHPAARGHHIDAHPTTARLVCPCHRHHWVCTRKTLLYSPPSKINMPPCFFALYLSLFSQLKKRANKSALTQNRCEKRVSLAQMRDMAVGNKIIFGKFNVYFIVGEFYSGRQAKIDFFFDRIKNSLFFLFSSRQEF